MIIDEVGPLLRELRQHADVSDAKAFLQLTANTLKEVLHVKIAFENWLATYMASSDPTPKSTC